MLRTIPVPAKDFLRISGASFQCLVEAFGFTRLGDKGDGDVFAVRYRTEDVKVTVNFEWREQYVRVLIGSNLVPAWQLEQRLPDASDAITAFDLEDLLALRSPKSGISPEMWGRALREGDFECVCAAYASALREHGSDVLRGDFSVLPRLVQIMKSREDPPH